uniref:Uncharacterized protein n=1 Tax=Magnetococcus massalia (strain MO-1) TaxID=451514 RepID=A0A1S7LFR3_MAGMO|nr:Conserved exported protein of unknown function. Similar to the Sulfur globule protein from Chromatium vinosum (Allochromatium vinosum) [Candidatus Magnetococcus massalia]
MATPRKKLSIVMGLAALTMVATVTTTRDAEAFFWNGPGWGSPWNGPGWGGPFGGPGWGGPFNGPFNGPWSGPGWGNPYYGYGAPHYGYGAPRYAAPYYPGSYGPAMTAPSQRFTDRDVAMLKQKLGVAPHQEEAWNQLVTAVKGLAPNASLLKDPKVNAAYQGLMAVLNPQQRMMAENFKQSLVW